MMMALQSHPFYVVMRGLSFLCRGNPNDGLTYHEAWIDVVDEGIIKCGTRAEAMEYKTHHLRQLRNLGHKVRSNCYRVVRVQFYWEEKKRGEKV